MKGGLPGYAIKRGKKWHIGFINARGIQERRTTEAQTKTEEMRIAFDLERRGERLRLGIEEPAPALTTFAELAKRHMDDVGSLKRWSGTIDARTRLHLIPEFGELPLEEVKPVLTQRLLARKLESGLAPQTVGHLRRTLRAMLNRATTWELFVGMNPAVAVAAVPIPRHEVNVLDREEVPRLIAEV